MLLIFGGLLLGGIQLYLSIRGRRVLEPSKFYPRALLLVSGVFPIGYIMWKDPVLYDGLRHVLFALPLLVAVAALTVEWCLRWSEQQASRLLLPVLQFGAVAAVGIVVFDMWRLHPYQYVYFNQISGSLPAAYNRDETDYWGLSHKEAGEWLNQYVATIDPSGERVFKVHQRYSRWMLQEALNPDRFEMWQAREGADFYVSITRFNLHASYPEAELLHVVERQGVPLCFIYKFNDEVVK